MLKGQARIDFEKWYLEPEQKKTYKTLSNKGGDKAIMLNWYSLSDSHRYGVIVDWFESVLMYINIYRLMKEGGLSFTINGDAFFGSEYNFKTTPKTRQKSIEKAVEIYNENN